MTVQRLEHIGIVVDELAAATALFAALGLELEGEASVAGGSVDRINGLEGVRADIVILRTPDGNAKVERERHARRRAAVVIHAPGLAGTPSRRHTVTAASNASSASWKSPACRIRVASTIARSSRNAPATAAETGSAD